MEIFLFIVIPSLVVVSVVSVVIALLLASLLASTSVSAISLVLLAASLLVIVVGTALPVVSFPVLIFFALTLLALRLPLGFPLLLSLAPFFQVGVVLLCSLITVALKSLLVEQEVDLHALVSIRQMALPLYLDHVVESAGFLPLIDLKHDADLVLALASIIANRGHIYPFSSKTRQEFHGLSSALTMVVVLSRVLLLILIGLEQVDLKSEGRLFLLDCLHEEAWIVLVVQTVVRFRVDLSCVEALMLLTIVPLIIAVIVVPSAISSVIIAATAFAIIAALSSIIVIVVIVAATARASARLLLVAVLIPVRRIGWPVILLIIINCVSSIRPLAVTIITGISSIICFVLRTIIRVGLLSFGRCNWLGS